MSNPESSLPPGFRFHPTDEELILHYLRNRATSNPCPVSIIAEVDIYKFDPWDLPAKASFGETEWYFFSPRDRKYPNGTRPNRAAGSGYWKATGTDKPILRTGVKEHIGVKKALVFYKGRPPKGIKTNWIMHEYRLAQLIKSYKPMKFKDSSMKLDDWVLCRIYKKSSHTVPSTTTTAINYQEQDDHSIKNISTSAFPSSSGQSTLQLQKSTSLSDIFASADFSQLAYLLSDNTSNSAGLEATPFFSNANYNSQHINNCNFIQKLPQEDPSFQAMGSNQLKRQQPISEDPTDIFFHPSKKFNSSCNFTNMGSQMDTSQYHSLNQALFNHQILLNSHLEL